MFSGPAADVAFPGHSAPKEVVTISDILGSPVGTTYGAVRTFDQEKDGPRFGA